MNYSNNEDKVPLGIFTCILEILTLTAIATIVKFASPNISVITILLFMPRCKYFYTIIIYTLNAY